jgi:hypothetical protein
MGVGHYQPFPFFRPMFIFFLHQLYGYNSPLWNNLTTGEAKLVNYSSTALIYHLILT